MAAESAKTESMKTTESAAAHGPVVVDIGKKRRKQIKQLRKGHGKLMDQIAHLVEELKAAGSISAGTQPLVVVVKEKRKSKSLLWS